MTYRGQEAREALMGDIAGAFADAMEKTDDKDRVALLQARIEAAITERLDQIYPTLEGAKCVRVVATYDGIKGPDGEVLGAWLEARGVDTAWMAMQPFVIDYEDGYIDYDEFLHTTAGEIVYDRDQQPKRTQRTKSFTDKTPLPDLKVIRVERIR